MDNHSAQPHHLMAHSSHYFTDIDSPDPPVSYHLSHRSQMQGRYPHNLGVEGRPVMERLRFRVAGERSGCEVQERTPSCDTIFEFDNDFSDGLLPSPPCSVAVSQPFPLIDDQERYERGRNHGGLPTSMSAPQIGRMRGVAYNCELEQENAVEHYPVRRPGRWRHVDKYEKSKPIVIPERSSQPVCSSADLQTSHRKLRDSLARKQKEATMMDKEMRYVHANLGSSPSNSLSSDSD